MVTSMEMKGEEENRTVVVMGRAEIDTRSPFKSVKEAVSLFGERVLVKEIYGYKLKEKQAAASIENGGSDHKTRIGALTAELEGARQSLQKTKEEITKMSKCTRTLKQELEETKKELKLMKAKEYYNLKPQPVDNDDDGDDNYPKIEDLKFVENANPKEEEECDQKRRFVTFASPPALAQVIVGEEEMEMKRSPFDWGNKKMTKKKPLMMKPLIGWLFSVKKSGGGHNSSRRETC